MKKLLLSFAVIFSIFFLSNIQTSPYTDMLDQRNKILGITPTPKPIPIPAPVTQTELTLLTKDLTTFNAEIASLLNELNRLDQQTTVQKSSS